jgi:uncharacterized protein YecE (DUF72 family)
MNYYRAIIIVYSHGNYIINKKKTMIVKSIYLHDISYKPLLLVQNKYALGIIELGDVIEINKRDFNKYFKYHLVTREECKLWWPNKNTFYLYPITHVRQFIPFQVTYSQGPQVLITPGNIKLVQKIYIGTSGYDYQWNYYPKHVNKLMYYANNFNSLEVNTTFYNIHNRDIWSKWLHNVNHKFVFTCKVNRTITHYQQFNKFSLFWKSVSALLPNLKCLLFQFPQRFQYNEINLDKLNMLRPEIKCAFEFKNTEWFNKTVYDYFKKRRWSIVISHYYDSGFAPKLNKWIQTSNHIYFRLHGTTDEYMGSYVLILKKLALFIRSLDIKYVFVFFNNTDSNHNNEPDAIYDAKKLQQLLF